MNYRVRDVLAHTEALWPAEGAEDWDVVGLVTGALDAKVAKILLVVDVTADTVAEAIDGGYDMIVAHHPLLLRGVTSVSEDRFKGDALARLIRANCAVVSVHTNGDRVATGTSATLAELLGVSGGTPIVPHPAGGGLGIVGAIETTTLSEFARRIAKILPSTAGGVRVAGDVNQRVSTVAVCAGAGDSLLGNEAVNSADVYVTSDLRHHPASEFRDNARLHRGTALIDVSHWAAEWLWLSTAARELSEALPDASIDVSELNTDPWTFVVMQ